MKKIPSNSKILSVSHDDMDGVGCQIVLGAIFKNIEYLTCSYSNIDKELMAIDGKEYDYIFVTDITPKVSEVLDAFNNIILIDHHQNAINDPSKHRYVNKKYSATYLTNHFLTKMFGDTKLKHLSKIVKLINDYDTWTLKYKGSKTLNDLFSLYNSKKFRSRFSTGDLSLSTDEKKYLFYVQDKYNKVYDELIIEEFETINACWFESDVFVNEIANNLMIDYGYDFVMFNTMKSHRVSIRSKMKDFNFGLYLKENNFGGGHKQAAGINADTEEDMMRIVDFIENDLYNKLPLIRK